MMLSLTDPFGILFQYIVLTNIENVKVFQWVSRSIGRLQVHISDTVPEQTAVHC